MKDYMIGALVITNYDDEGIIIDRVLSVSNGGSYTKYLIMKKDRTVVNIDFDDISEVIELPNGNPVYFDKVDKFSL